MSRRPLGLLAAAAALGACVDFDATVDPTGGLSDVAVVAPSFSTDVQPIFVRRCADGGCHSLGSHQAGLILTADSAYAHLVNRPAAFTPGVIRVRPGSSSESWLVTMIGPDDARRRGRVRMPLASTPLTPNQITTIVNWIDRGAPRN